MSSNTKKNKYHAAIGKVLSSKKKKHDLFFLKNELDYDTLSEVCDTLTKSAPPLKYSFFGTPLPKTIDLLGQGEKPHRSKVLENEFKWAFLSIKSFASQISLFLILKKDFENNFLLGKFDAANDTLEIIKKDIGISLWYIEAKFLLLEYLNKSEEQKEFLSEINGINRNGLITSLAHFLSQRTERNLSASKYDYDLRTIFARDKKALDIDVKNYYLFRLNYFEYYHLADQAMVVVFENYNSVIDRYLVLRDILKALFLKKDHRDFACSRARYLHKKISDEDLFPMLIGTHPKEMPAEYINKDFLRILEFYYSGLYEDVINECLNYIPSNPNIFDLLIIYCRSHISLRKEYTNIGNEISSPLNLIGQKIFNLLSNENDNNANIIYNLYQINKNIYSFAISSGLNYLLKNEQRLNPPKELKLLSLNCFDPYFCRIFSNNSDAEDYLDCGLSYFPGAISIQHNKRLLENEPFVDSTLSVEISEIANAKILFRRKEYELSLKKWKEILNQFPNNNPIVQTALNYWFECLINLNDHDSAITMYVDNYITNANSVNKIDTSAFIKKMRKSRYKGIKRSIDLPIFISLNSTDDPEKSFILEQYCRSFGKVKPSQLFSENMTSNVNKIECFFSIACNQETLRHSIYINKTLERLTERLNILNYLIEKFLDNKKSYQEELNQITNELIISEGTQKLDESKIYANDQAIITNELKDAEGLFNRFKTIYKIQLKDKQILLISGQSFALFQYDGDESYNESEVKYTKGALSQVFTELFDLILEKFLFSKFGIVAYLSTRIRHGVLLGELRPEIDKQNLILDRIGHSERYKTSEYWNSSFFNLDQATKQKLHEILCRFSLSVDTLIEEIIKARIQIKKDGKNDKGLFNYEFDTLELRTLIDDISVDDDYKVFCQKVIDFLWIRTDANLEIIRAFLESEVKVQLSDLLNNLENDIRISLGDKSPPQIYTCINDCSTILENKIVKISSWFRRSGSQINDFEIFKLFNIVWTNVQKAYPKASVSCEMKQSANPTIKAKYYIHFADLFRIFLDNMFKYGGFENSGKPFTFECELENSILKCRFTNLKSPEFSELPYRGDAIDTNKLNSEGKSGYYKAIKIVKYDLDNENNSIGVSVENSNYFSVVVLIDITNLVKNETSPNS